MYLTRSHAPRKWPLPRKGTKYLVRPAGDRERGLPLLIIIRDILGLAQSKKETQKLLNLGKIKVNYKPVKKVNYSIGLFDVLNLNGNNYKLVLEGKKFSIKEVKGDESKEKIARVDNKKILKGEKTQINLSDGRNYIMDKKVIVGSSVIIDLEKSKIKKVLPLKEGVKVLFISGKHTGSEGKIKSIKEEIVAIVDESEIKTKKDSFIVIK